MFDRRFDKIREGVFKKLDLLGDISPISGKGGGGPNLPYTMISLFDPIKVKKAAQPCPRQ